MNSNPNFFQQFKRIRFTQIVLSLLAMFLLTACLVNSTDVDDSNLIAKFLVQNDNGQTTALVTLDSKDLAGQNEVTLVAGESIFYQRNGQGGELSERDDGEYTASLPDDAEGLYDFTIVRRLDGDEDTARFSREVTDNHVYLPNTFQELQAESVQSGSVVSLSWLEETVPQDVTGFTIYAVMDTFNAIGSCQNGDEPFDVAITEGRIAQQSGRLLLEIEVVEHLTQVVGLPVDAATTTACEIDVQLVREITGITDDRLNRRSSATGRVLKNVVINFTG